MEKKKLLIVAVSVGVVLLIIIGIPLLMIAPRQNVESVSANVERDWVTAVEPGVHRLQPAVGEDAVTQASFADRVQPVENVFTPPADTSQITLSVPIPQTAAVPHAPVAPAQRPAAARPQAAAPAAKSTPPVQSTPVVKSEPAAKPAPAPKETVKTPAAKPAAPAAKTHDNFWVQTGAFSTVARAESVKESLASKGFASVIDNRDIAGKTWYRVRVGPYTSETEANYWLALVKSIDGFGESQIRLTQALQ